MNHILAPGGVSMSSLNDNAHIGHSKRLLSLGVLSRNLKVPDVSLLDSSSRTQKINLSPDSSK